MLGGSLPGLLGEPRGVLRPAGHAPDPIVVEPEQQVHVTLTAVGAGVPGGDMVVVGRLAHTHAPFLPAIWNRPRSTFSKRAPFPFFEISRIIAA